MAIDIVFKWEHCIPRILNSLVLEILDPVKAVVLVLLRPIDVNQKSTVLQCSNIQSREVRIFSQTKARL